MSTHTRGPWEACEQDRVLTGPHAEEHACWFITGEDGTDDGVCVASLDSGYTGAQTEANARLIAAAPDLLEIVRDLLNAHNGAVNVSDDPFPEDLHRSAEWIARIHAAIAKAEGGR